EEDQTCITTDNGSNVVKAVELNHWTRLQCFGHRLHLAIENALKEKTVKDRINRATGLCRSLVCHFSHSWKKKAALSEAQRELHLPEHSLITECPTRWGSRQKMIGRVLEQRKALSQVLSEDRKTRHLVPSWQDIEVLESINNALRPLQEFTDALSGEAYVSVSYLKPVLHLLKTSTLAAKDEDTALTKKIKSLVLGYMENKYSDPATQELLDITSFIDPRFKTDYMSAEKVPDIKARVKIEMEQVARKEKRVQASTTDAVLPSAGEAEPSTSKKAKRSLGSFFKSSTAVPPGPASTAVQLESAIEAERLFTLETCCGYGYGLARDLHLLPRIFKGQRELTGRRRNRNAFQGTGPSLGANPFQGALPFTKKRELSPGLPPASPGSFASPHWTPRGTYLRHSRFGDLNPTPFRSAEGDVGHRPTLQNGVRPSLRTD
ncbi:hypothetical protein JOQ06_022404, partial [Pogonophryne albipinna]